MSIRRILLAVGLAVLLAAIPTYAAGVHLKGGKNAEPTFTDNVFSLAAAGKIAGLRNGDVQATLTAALRALAPAPPETPFRESTHPRLP